MSAKRFVEVLGRQMAYLDVGEGPVVVLLHGNPTSSFLWRNVWPHLVDRARCVVPDLIGMGDSDKLEGSGDDRYRFDVHRRHLDALLQATVGDAPVVLVLHDWGSALGFDWANRHRDQVAGIAYMESIVRPFEWSDWPDETRDTFRALRSPDGERLVLDENLFVERMLVRHPIPIEDHDEYRRPFAEPGETRRPTLTWPRQLPIGGEPADVVATVAAYGEWLRESGVPKLFIDADPGSILVGRARDFCRGWPNQREVRVAGGHFVPEWSPDEIGEAIAAWVADTIGWRPLRRNGADVP